MSLSFPGCSDGKESACDVGDLALIPGMGRFRREWYLCLENSIQRSLASYSPWGHRDYMFTHLMVTGNIEIFEARFHFIFKMKHSYDQKTPINISLHGLHTNNYQEYTFILF